MSLQSTYHYDMADVTFYLLDISVYRRDHEYVFYVCLTELSYFFALLRKEAGYKCMVLLTCPAAKILQQVPGAS